jgi:putative toxin-antitoxin system antitoxin component (TIGR02293 family)
MELVTIHPLSGQEVVDLRAHLDVGRDRLASALGLAPKTLNKVESENGSPLPAVLDKLAALRHVLFVAEDVLGNRKAACAWLVRPHPHYAGTAPLDMLRTYSGTVEVLRALDRIAEGVMS